MSYAMDTLYLYFLNHYLDILAVVILILIFPPIYEKVHKAFYDFLSRHLNASSENRKDYLEDSNKYRILLIFCFMSVIVHNVKLLLFNTPTPWDYMCLFLAIFFDNNNLLLILYNQTNMRILSIYGCVNRDTTCSYISTQLTLMLTYKYAMVIVCTFFFGIS